VHSPFVFDLIENVFKSPLSNSKSNAIEVERKFLLKDEEEIYVEDLGTGHPEVRLVKDIANSSLKEPKEAAILGRLAEYYQPCSILELGTSLGISTAYLAQANKPVYSIEGSPNVLEKAKSIWESLHLSNIETYSGDFESLLEEVWPRLKNPVMVFLDGNHTHRATLRYFEYVIDRLEDNSIIVFDDIYWSPGMEKAWEKIYRDKRVPLSIDIFEMGLVFLKPGIQKQHFILRF
jgi:predicted O-methyltransferase YrrM